MDRLLIDLFGGRDFKPSPTEVANEYEAFLAGYIDVINQKTGEIYDPKDYKEISNRTITTFLNKWEVKIGTHAKRSGNRQQLMQNFIPYESMERPTLAGSIISIDDRQPPFEYEKLINLLKQVEGKTIDIYWLDDENGSVYKAMIFDRKEGRYIGEVLPKPISARSFKEETEEQRNNRVLMAKYRNTVTSYMQIQKNAIEPLKVIDNRPITVSSTFSIPGI